jgi:hypothetical protein
MPFADQQLRAAPSSLDLFEESDGMAKLCDEARISDTLAWSMPKAM